MKAMSGSAVVLSLALVVLAFSLVTLAWQFIAAPSAPVPLSLLALPTAALVVIAARWPRRR